MVTVVSSFLPLRMKFSLAFEPGLREAMSATRSSPVFSFFAIDRGDGIADLQSRLVGRAAGDDVRNRYTRSVDMRDRGIRLGGKFDADRTTRHAVFGSNQLVINLGNGVRRHGKADARVGTGLGQNGGVDADDFARHVDQRSTGIAGVNGRVGLNKGLELAVGNDVAALGGDDARGYGFLQSERTADGQNPVAHLHAVGVADFRRRQRVIDLNFDDCQVGLLIHADHFGVVTGRSRVFILQLHANAIRLFDHVAVGDDVALGINDDAGSERALANVSGIGPALAAEKFVKEILERAVILPPP